MKCCSNCFWSFSPCDEEYLEGYAADDPNRPKAGDCVLGMEHDKNFYCEKYSSIDEEIDDNELIRDKLYTILTANKIVEEIRKNIDFLKESIPEIEPMIGFDQKHPHHHLDVFEHTLLALSLSENNFVLRLALLLHDIGKPFSYIEGEVRHFPGHPEVSAKMSEEILKRLGFEGDFINMVCYLIKGHDTNISKEEIEKNYNLNYLRLLEQRCDALAHHPERLEKRQMYLKRTKEMFNDRL